MLTIVRGKHDIPVSYLAISKPGFWLAGSKAASQSETMFKISCSLAWILTQKFIFIQALALQTMKLTHWALEKMDDIL